MLSTEEMEALIRKQVADELNFDEYFLNPLVNDTESYAGPMDTVDKMLKQLEAQDGGSIHDEELTMSDEQKEVLKILGIDPGTVKGGTAGMSYGDPFYHEGRLVRYTRYFAINMEVAQNQSMTGYQDYYEDGRLVAFSISCNDHDMIPIVFIENSAGSKDIINDLSYKEAVVLGRGMTFGEATSQVRTPQGFTSRDISGQRSTVFPYVSRYKDTFSGTNTEYEQIKGTIDDKYYVMEYQPDLWVPYKRLYIDVYNGSTSGTRLIHRMEIKRLVYITSDQVDEYNKQDTEFTKLNKALQSIYDKINGKPKETPVLPTNEQPTLPSDPVSTATFARKRKRPSLFSSFIAYLYNKTNPDQTSQVNFAGTLRPNTPTIDRLNIEDVNAQRNLIDLKRRIGQGRGPAQEAIENIIIEEGATLDGDDGVMEMRMF